MRRIVSVALAATLIAGLSAINAAPSHASPEKRHTATGRIIVGYVDGATPEARGHARGHAKAELVKQVKAGGPSQGAVEVVTAVGGANADDVMADLASDPDVAYAEPDAWLTPAVTPNDPELLNLWGMGGTYGSQAPTAWANGNTGSSNVYVGIVDTGIDYSHPDLTHNIWTNAAEIPGNGIDDDGDGFVDDVHGFDFFHDDGSVYDAADGDNHGTHVAGTIGAEGDNGIGVVGMNWHVTMISAKFLGPNGGYTSDAVSAIDYLTKLKLTKGLNIVAINNSWGGGGYSQALQDAITRAAKADILFIAAAGNSSSNNDTTAAYPADYSTTSTAGYESVIAVAALTSTGGLASYSNYGPKTVDLGAPGSSIESTLPGNTYGYYSGTSMATPHVTGAVALYANSHPGASAATIRSAILSSTTPTSSLTGKTVTGGRLDVSTFGSVAPPPPDPTTGTVTGIVTDNTNGTVVSGAAVTLSGATVSTASTDPTGHYTFTVAGGAYSLSVTKSGYLDAGPVSVTVTNGSSTTQNVGLSKPITATQTSATWAKSGGGWKYQVTLKATSGADAVSGAVISGQWSYGSSASCQTNSSGTCTVQSVRYKNQSNPPSFLIASVTKSGYVAQ